MRATLADLAAEEKAQAPPTKKGGQKPNAQHIANILLKHQAFRDIVEFKPNVAQKGPLIDTLLKKVMGDGCAIGSCTPAAACRRSTSTRPSCRCPTRRGPWARW